MMTKPARNTRAAAFTVLLLALPATPVLAAGSGGTDSATNTAAPSYAAAKADVDAGRYRQAIRTLRTLVKADGQNADAWNLLGYSSRKLKNFEDAGKYYQAALKLDPKHLGALEYQGELFVETGAYDQAKVNLGRLKALCGNCEEYGDLSKALAAVGQS